MKNVANAKYVVIGAGIHGLSTAYHLALELRARKEGGGGDIVIIDKEEVGAGASGIACGVIRNNYFQPAMRELMVQSVEVWESDKEAYSYHPVGYIQIAPEIMREHVAGIAQEQRDIGYESVLVEGEKACSAYMRNIFHDWRATDITCLLHEKRGGYANNIKSMQGLEAKVKSQGVRILTQTELTGFRFDAGGSAIVAVETSAGEIACEQVVVAVGPWVKQVWEMLSLPRKIEMVAEGNKLVPMWVYWCLQEGTLDLDPSYLLANDGSIPPVIHVDSVVPLHSDVSGELLTDEMWGIYYKPDWGFGGVQGGAAPYRIDVDPDKVRVDPYGPASPDFVVGEDFADMWVSALAHCQKRFAGTLPKFRKEPSGGIGAFTPDSFPIFDVFHDNCYVIADSNHGYKMLGIGKLVAEELLGEKSEMLQPFRFSRYSQGRVHPVSNSPFPWS